MSEGRVFHNLIGGEFVPAQSGKTFERRNPADTRDLVGVFADSDERDVYAAVEAAKAAFPTGAKYRRQSVARFCCALLNCCSPVKSSTVAI